MAGREDEAVAVGPLRVNRVVPEEPREQDVCHRRGAEGKARVTRVRGFDRIDRKASDCVDAELVNSVESRRSGGCNRCTGRRFGA